jgi:hypothetical protein
LRQWRAQSSGAVEIGRPHHPGTAGHPEIRRQPDLVVLENYDDRDYGYLRMVVSPTHLRIEYHPASDGTWTKAPDDFATVELASRKIVHYHANDLGHPAARQEVAMVSAQSPKKT